MSINSLLEQLGLTSGQARIYMKLLEMGPQTISGISRETGLHRPLIYKELPILVSHGLVTLAIRGSRKLYVAESPEKLEVIFTEVKKQFDDSLPELKSMYLAGSQKPIVKYLVGKKGIASIFDDIVSTLKRGDVYYRYSSRRSEEIYNAGFLSKEYKAKRDNKQIERLVITSESQASQKKPSLERSVKIVPKEYDLFDYNITQVIYKDSVVFIDYNSLTALSIKNPIIAEFQRKIFKLLFEKL